MKWRVDVYIKTRETHYFKNKNAAFDYISTIPAYLYIELFKFDGQIWNSIKIFWG